MEDNNHETKRNFTIITKLYKKTYTNHWTNMKAVCFVNGISDWYFALCETNINAPFGSTNSYIVNYKS